MMDETLCSQIVAGAADGVIVADAAGAIRLWNDGARRIFGFGAEEAVGRSLDLIIPAAQRDRHWEGYRRVMETGRSRYGTDLLKVPAVRKDGTRLSIEFSIVLLRDEAGHASGAAAIVRDVTARWTEERALRARLHELERGAS